MSITIDVPQNIENILDIRCQDEHIDRMSVLKQMLWDGVESDLLNQYSDGKISKGKLAELLNSDIYEVNELLDEYHVKSSISYEKFTRGIQIAENTGEYDCVDDDR